jgi:hypothetical protein
VQRIAVADGATVDLPSVRGGSHLSFVPDESVMIDVVDHRTLWRSPLAGGAPEQLFAFDDPNVRIDYPVISPDGRWLLFDRLTPLGGDLWRLRPAAESPD